MSSHPGLSGHDGVPLAGIIRDGIVESVHHAIVAVVDSTGTPLLERGATTQPVYPRSTLKPLQTLAVLATGVSLSPLEVALTTASHCGSREHREAIESFLARHRLSADSLQCPLDWPLGSTERAEMEKAEGSKSRVAMNCSGKHVGFLAACAHAGWDIDSYLDPAHPLQRSIKETIEKWTGEPINHSSVDGCGAPLHQVSLRALSRALAGVAKGDTPDTKTLVDSLGAYPWALDGRGRANTLTIERLGGVAKIGAEGLVVIALPTGIAVSVKVLDGSMRATTPIALEALFLVGAISADDRDSLLRNVAEPVLGGGAVLGGLEVWL